MISGAITMTTILSVLGDVTRWASNPRSYVDLTDAFAGGVGGGDLNQLCGLATQTPVLGIVAVDDPLFALLPSCTQHSAILP